MATVTGEETCDVPFNPSGPREAVTTRMAKQRQLPAFRLRFQPDSIAYWAGRYKAEDDRTVEHIGRTTRSRGYYERDGFLQVCEWKTSRARSRRAANTAEDVHEITRLALSARNERLRIEALNLLDGVSWPTASVLLHLAHRDPYPILDVRALWSLGVDAPSYYDFSFWWAYVGTCRALALSARVNMRTLDRSLWQYSKENAYLADA